LFSNNLMCTSISLLSILTFLFVGAAPLASAYSIEDVTSGAGYFDYNRQVSSQDEWPSWVGRRSSMRIRLSPFVPSAMAEAPEAQLSVDWPDWIGR